MIKMGQIVSSVLTLLLATGLCLSMLFVEKKHTTLVCQHIEIDIKNHRKQSFITEKGILDLLQSMHQNALVGTPLKKIDTYAIQNQLASQPLVKSVLVFKTWSGTLKIFLETKYLIARIISPIGPNGTQIYVDENGDLISIKGLFRLLVIGGKNIVTEKGRLQNKGLLALLHYLYNDPFFCYQITSLQVEDHDTILLGTQVGHHQIAFGSAEKIHEKFEKLRLFYSQVIPYKGWNAYHRVNLEFEDQLICE